MKRTEKIHLRVPVWIQYDSERTDGRRIAVAVAKRMVGGLVSDKPMIETKTQSLGQPKIQEIRKKAGNQ